MTVDPHWSTIVSALVVAIFAVFGAYIAWNLWKTNHDLLRERLYDRRFEIFEATQGLIAEINEQGGLTWDAAKQFSDIAQRARFMFSTEDAQYFETLRARAMELAKITSVTDARLQTQATAERDEQWAMCVWFNEQVEEVFARMNKYLLFEK